MGKTLDGGEEHEMCRDFVWGIERGRVVVVLREGTREIERQASALECQVGVACSFAGLALL